ncbi:MAG: ferritin-like domain-containing protein [Verrucomicrobiaceae bacterium]|nr:ferritin-like domain-containing protein [Verrucomicrobiaceae bacterium]
MEDLARRVLFATDLDEKLRLARRPLAPVDPSPPSPSGSDSWEGVLPGRPEHLRFASASAARPSLPTRPGLVDEANRGVLLHFFANHELLAAELMALALLKFPDAPVAFREGLANTLREEQLHTRWYVNRMRECGVEFGQYPLSRYFWEAVSRMESPLDYVSRLSLTFEQANLDYALHYGHLLREAGDGKSASILLRIYEDEIAHVGYGLSWFRRWKEEKESDWAALQRQLPFPLSPSRAKGNRTAFNEAGRRAAGFDEDYIQRLALFERSKGRSPNVFYFNPEAEHRAAVWPRPYHPNKNTLAVIHDLELLAAFLARKDDVLLMRKLPSQAHLAKLRRCGFPLPELEALDATGKPDPAALLVHRKIHRLRPWSLAPDLDERFQDLRRAATSASATAPWSEKTRRLFSKISQVRALPRWMAPSYPCRDADDLTAAVAALRAGGYREAILKRAFSTAGSGMTRLDLNDAAAIANRPFSEQILAEGGILLEPAHDRVFDFSVQYQIEDGAIRFLGFVEQIIAKSGGYRGSHCQTKFCKGLDPLLARTLSEEVLPLYAADGALAEDLFRWAGDHHYEGPLGIDTYLHRDPRNPGGPLVLRPFCEINPRHTMGRVALELRRHIAPGCHLRFEIIKAENATDHDDAPLLDEKGRCHGGSLLLTERLPTTRFVARATIGRRRPRPPHSSHLPG